MKNISRALLFLAFFLAVPAANADGIAALSFQSPNGVNDAGAYVSPKHEMDGLSQSPAVFATNLGEPTFQTHGDASSLSTQFVSQPHSNWIAAGSHRQVIGTVPEPNILLMFGAGLIGAGFCARRKAAILL